MASRTEQDLREQIDREGARLNALREVGLLDTGSDPALERLTRIASVLLGVPMSVVSLVDAERVYFAGATGMDERRELPLSLSCCRQVVASRSRLVVDDCRVTDLSSGTSDRDVVAYAGVPLTLDGGETLGAFCAIDRVPRAWTESEIERLEEVAALAVDVLEARRAAGRDLRDRLTGLAGRALFGELVTRTIARSVRGERACAVLALGLNGFRLVNDALGHSAGDVLLTSVAGRLSTALRSGDAACRLAADEFLVLCDALEDEREADAIAARLAAEITRTPYAIDGHDVPVAVTVGIAKTSAMVAADDLIAAALDALIHRKRGAAPEAVRPDPERRVRATRRLWLQQALHGVEARDELRLVYQPLVDLRDGVLHGCEALLRWTHPELGPVRPDEFIPVAERSGAIVPIGEWVLDRVARDLALWRRSEHGRDLTVAVNIAPNQLRGAQLVDRVEAIFAAHAVPPSALTLEITERVLLDDRPAYARAMAQLRELGVQIALDDFGTGYSALAYLARFPLDELKIDRGFVAGLESDGRARSLLEAITGMGAALGLRTVGEGIETEHQLAQLVSSGCDVGQGYHLARPVPAEALAPLLGRRWPTGGAGGEAAG